MTPNQIILTLREAGFSNYRIAKETGISRVTIGRLAKGTQQDTSTNFLRKLESLLPAEID